MSRKVWAIREAAVIYTTLYIARFLAALFSVSIDGCFQGNTPKQAVHVWQHESDVPLTIRSRDGNNCGGNYGHDWAKKREERDRGGEREIRRLAYTFHYFYFINGLARGGPRDKFMNTRDETVICGNQKGDKRGGYGRFKSIRYADAWLSLNAHWIIISSFVPLTAYQVIYMHSL